MDIPYQLLEKIDVANLIAMGAMFLVFKYHIDKRFDSIIGDSNKKFDKIDDRFDRIDADLKDIRNDLKEVRTSLHRMEGAFYNKDCYMLKDDRASKKVE